LGKHYSQRVMLTISQANNFQVVWFCKILKFKSYTDFFIEVYQFHTIKAEYEKDLCNLASLNYEL